MLPNLTNYTTEELLTALSGFLSCLESDMPNDEEAAAIYAVCAEIERRRSRDSVTFISA